MRSWIDFRMIEPGDLKRVMDIYNQGIHDRIATLETEEKGQDYMETWYQDHQGRYAVMTAVNDEEVVGWASLNPYSHRCAYDGVAQLSIYIDRDFRGKGIGSVLLDSLEQKARENNFHKIILFVFMTNEAGKSLYKKNGYREVGVFKEQGIFEGKYIDILAMEKLL